MKTSNLKSTYELVVESEHEDRNRSVLETILSAVFSIWQFAIQPVVVPTSVAAAKIETCQVGPC